MKAFVLLFVIVLLTGAGRADSGSQEGQSAERYTQRKYQSAPFLIGAGIGDVTGPAAEVGMMGYMQFSQTTWGIHNRLRARAFIFKDQANGNQFTFINLDVCFSTAAIKKTLIDELQKLFPNTFTHENLMISATHTHSGPGGFSWNAVYLLSTFGFQKDNRNAIVAGCIVAIKQALSRLKPAAILMNQGELINPQTNINRSPTAYEFNPPQERARYSYNVDKLMTLLRFQGQDKSEIGSLNWFPVHGTSMNNKNRYISSDNKGYAEILFERLINGNASLPGQGPFVTAFGQTNEGDVSPNTRGAFCDNGDPCEVAHSTCNGRSQGCHGYGPGRTDLESNTIIGRQQFEFALQLWKSAQMSLSGGQTDYRIMWINMSSVMVQPEWTGLPSPISTCVGAIGDATAGGTTDGPGDFNFKQGTNSSRDNPLWNMLGRFLKEPPKEQLECHKPKPILVWVGGIRVPTPWVPDVLPIHIVRLGQLFILGVPAEFSTMAGRRLKESTLKVLIANGAPNNSVVVIAGLANDYSQYVTTYEEYQVQRYEGSSTLYGPHTLNAYQQEFAKLATALMQKQPAPPAYSPPDWEASIVNILLQPGVWFDTGPFGKLVQDVKPSYTRGQNVTVVFYSGDPRNDYRLEGTFLTVERQIGSQWVVIANDGSYETFFRWQRHFSFPSIADSYAYITWIIPTDTAPGTYRIRHFGNSKSLLTGKITEFSGSSSTFTVN